MLRYGFRPSKIGFLAWHAWRDAARGEWPPGLPGGQARSPTTWPRSGAGSRSSAQRFFGFAQFKRSALPNGPKVVAGGSLSPRGDWRAPSDASAAAWLRDLERWDDAGAWAES